MIYPYKQGSNSAKLLADALKSKQISHKNSKFKGNPNKLIINWGASEVPEEVEKCHIINKPAAVKVASNKLIFFEKVNGKVSIPEYTTNKDKAQKWYDEGHIVVCRTKLNGHSGEGIYLFGNDYYQWDNNVIHGMSKLYVKYIPKKHEYRVHVVGGSVVDLRRKAKRNDIPKDVVNFKIRNYHNGFVFAKEGARDNLSPKVEEESLKAVEAVGLDFGAVDVIYNAYHDKAYVLEVNTAPGLEGSTVDNYAAAFAEFLQEPVENKGMKFAGDLHGHWNEIAGLMDKNGIKPYKKNVLFKKVDWAEEVFAAPQEEPNPMWELPDIEVGEEF